MPPVSRAGGRGSKRKRGGAEDAEERGAGREGALESMKLAAVGANSRTTVAAPPLCPPRTSASSAPPRFRFLRAPGSARALRPLLRREELVALGDPADEDVGRQHLAVAQRELHPAPRSRRASSGVILRQAP